MSKIKPLFDVSDFSFDLPAKKASEASAVAIKAVEIANAKFEKWLKKQKKVYANEESEYIRNIVHWDQEHDQYDTHEARLVGIKRIKK